MASPLGQSFAPIGAADEDTKKPNPAQQAIQVLSMRMPRVRGARAISPLAGDARSAAASQVGGFSPESAVLQTLLRTIAPSAPMGVMPEAGNPMAAAMAALGGGMARPAAPVIAPGIADPNRPVPPIVPGSPAPDAAAPPRQMPERPQPPAYEPPALVDPTVPGRGRRKSWS